MSDYDALARGGRTAGSVLHVMTTTQRRGAEVFATDLAPALTRHGWRSALVALTAATGDALPVEALGPSRLGPRTLRRLRERMQRSSVIIAHGSTTLPASSLGGIGTGVPLVYRSVGDPRYWASSGTRRLRTGVLLRRATRVVALTDQAAAALHDHYRLPLERIVVIPQGVSPARVVDPSGPSREGARATLGLPAEAPVALYLGALSAEKNVGLAIDAASRFDDLVLAIAGAGPERGALEARTNALPGRVHFLGDLRDPGAALAAVDLLVLPSHTEGMPGVAIEAGMAGVPVVATDVGWVRDIVVDGTTGVLTPPGDVEGFTAGISRALAQKESMGREARAHCLASFDIDVIASTWASMLSSIS